VKPWEFHNICLSRDVEIFSELYGQRFCYEVDTFAQAEILKQYRNFMDKDFVMKLIQDHSITTSFCKWNRSRGLTKIWLRRFVLDADYLLSL
jgi:hypothetical protein